MVGLVITQNGVSQAYGNPGADAYARALRAAQLQTGQRTPVSPSLQRMLSTQPQSENFNADAYVADMTMAELYNLIGTGANLPGAGDRLAAKQAAQRRISELTGPTNPPTTNGMGANGQQIGQGGPIGYPDGSSINDDSFRGTNEIPIPNTVTDYGPGSDNDIVGPRASDFDPTAGYNNPPTNGMGADGRQVGMTPITIGGSGVTGPGAGPGGGDPVNPGDYNTNAWGQHSNFYNQQLGALINQQNATREAQTAAALRAQEAANTPQQGQAADWSWANLPDVQVQGRGGDWSFAEGLDITRGQTTNQQILDQLNLPDQTRNWFTDHWSSDNPTGQDSLYWSTFTKPSDIPLQGDADSRAAYNNLSNALFQQSGVVPGNVPAGYAAPIAGFRGVTNPYTGQAPAAPSPYSFVNLPGISGGITP